MNRLKLLLILASMPDEAFGWFVVWAARGAPGGAHTQPDIIGQMFPDGLGGFSAEARAAIEALRAAAREYAGA